MDGGDDLPLAECWSHPETDTTTFSGHMKKRAVENPTAPRMGSVEGQLPSKER